MAAMLDYGDVELVQESFASLLANPIQAGERFYHHLFEKYPQVRPLFKADPSEQAEKFITMLSYIVSCLDNLDELDATLHQLGRRHVAYRTEPGHYAAVREVLLLTIRELALAEDMDAAIAAWGRFYDLIAERMLAAQQS